MKELIEALGPWPMLQGILLGMIVAGGGAWAILRGLQGRGRDPAQLEEAKARWEIHNWFDHIHENSFKMVDLLEKQHALSMQILTALNRANDQHWNGRQ